MKPLFSIVFFLLTFNVLAQETTDSVYFELDNSKFHHISTSMLNLEFAKNYPLSGDLNINARMNDLIFNYQNTKENNFVFVSNPYNSFYYYSKNGYSFFQNSRPLYVKANWHLGETFNWEKFDLFFDASALRTNEYQELQPDIPLEREWGVMWEVGAGAGYKINKTSTIFIRGSMGFKNTGFIGSKGLTGINAKF